MKNIKFNKKEKGIRIDNLPDTGTLTGRYFTDYHGTWYEVCGDDESVFWMIGDPKKS